MAFGAEVKDFISGFQAGYSMFKSKEEKEWEEELKQMKREQHRLQQEEFQFRKDRAAVGDSQWEQEFGFRVDESGRQHSRWEEDQIIKRGDLKLRQDEARLKWAEKQGENPDTSGVGDRYESPYDKDSLNNSTAIPEGAGVDTSSVTNSIAGRQVASAGRGTVAGVPVQQASYGGGATGAMNAYAGGAAGSAGASAIERNFGEATGKGSGASFIRYQNQSAIRNKPLSSRLEKALGFLPELGVEAVVFSGGQDGKRRTGSTRHDHGNAADVFFYKDGRKLDWADPNDRPIFEEIVRRGKSNGLTGFGAGPGYMRPGSMHIGFGTPAVWGAGGKGTKAPDWLRKAYGMARGGMVTALPDDEEDPITLQGNLEVDGGPAPDPDEPHLRIEASAIDDGTMTDETAIPTPTPRPDDAPSGEQPTESRARPLSNGGQLGPNATQARWEAARASVKKGLEASYEQAGFNINSAIDDPELEKLRQNLIRGYGAAPEQMMRQVIDKIDPERQMPPAERNMAAMAEVWRFYVERGQEDKAQAAAQSMLQYYRRAFQQFSALSVAALEKGDIDNATKAAIAAYAQIPNGRDLSVKKLENGRYEVSVTDMETGKQVNKQVMDPERFASLAMNFNPAMFEDEIMNAAGQPINPREEASTEALANIETSIKDALEEDFPTVASLPAGARQEFTMVATDIAADKRNQVTGGGAVKFLHDMLQFDPEDLEKNDKLYEGRVTRDGDVKVTDPRTGRSIRMTKNAYAALESLRNHFVNQRKAQAEEDAKPGWGTTLWENTKRVAGAISENVKAGEKALREGVSNIGAAQRRANGAQAIPDDTPAPDPVNVDDPEIAELQDMEQQLKYQGVADNDPRMIGIRRRLRELGVQ